ATSIFRWPSAPPPCATIAWSFRRAAASFSTPTSTRNIARRGKRRAACGPRSRAPPGFPFAMDEPLWWVDGDIVAEDDFALPVDDRGLAYGDGLFETILVVKGQPIWLMAHMGRLRRPAPGLGYKGVDTLMRRGALGARELLQAARPARGALRITWTRGSGLGGFAPPDNARPRIVVRLAPVAPRKLTGVRAITLPDLHGGSMAQHKSCSALAYVEAARPAPAKGVEDALLSRRPASQAVRAGRPQAHPAAGAASAPAWRHARLGHPARPRHAPSAQRKRPRPSERGLSDQQHLRCRSAPGGQRREDRLRPARPSHPPARRRLCHGDEQVGVYSVGAIFPFTSC